MATKQKGAVKVKKLPKVVEDLKATEDTKVLKAKLLAACKNTKNTPIPMGMGVIGRPDTIIGRKFRWTLDGQNLPSHFAVNVKFDYVKKLLSFEYYDVFRTGEGGLHALLWAEKLQNRELPNETLTFKAYDGCGFELESQVFTGLSLVDHTSDFDYSISEPAAQRITVSYTKVNITLSERFVCKQPSKQEA